MRLQPIAFLAVVLAGVALVPPGAHLYELANKIAMPEDEYFVVQSIYRGWWMAGFALPAAWLANLALAYAARADRKAAFWACAAAGLIMVNLAIFFMWTEPANRATASWTQRPAEWRDLRAQWEYSHAANAVVTFAAFCCSVAAALSAARVDAETRLPSRVRATVGRKAALR